MGLQWWCGCHKQVGDQDCMDANGTMQATCNHCHDQWHISYQWHQAEDTEEGNDDKNTPDNQEQDGGIEIIEDEHFDNNPA